MENNEFNLLVLKYFYALKEKYDYAISVEWGDEIMGSTILLEDYLVPYLYDNIDNIDVMNTMSDFLEDILSYNDDFCEEVLYCAFFEKIHYDEMEDKFICHYKEKTMKFFRSIAFY